LPKGPPPQPPQNKKNIYFSAPSTPGAERESIHPLNSTTAPADAYSMNSRNKPSTATGGGFTFSFDYNSNHTFNLSSSSTSKSTHTTTKKGNLSDAEKAETNGTGPPRRKINANSTRKKSKPSPNGHRNNGGIQKDNPLSSYLESSSDEEQQHILDQLDRASSRPEVDVSDLPQDAMDLTKMKSTPTPITMSFAQQARVRKQKLQKLANAAPKNTQSTTSQKALNSSIRDDYFDNKDEDGFPPVIPSANSGSQSYNNFDIELAHHLNNPNRRMSDLESKGALMLQRTRSKSVGSFAEILNAENPTTRNAQKPSSVDDYNKSAQNMHRMSPAHGKRGGMGADLAMSPIYKDLAEMSKKLTILSFGASRRPNQGNLHCVIRVETNEYKGQAAIPLKWEDFSNEVEQTQYAELFHHGVPIYDKTGSPIRVKVQYKLSLIDKQIVFHYQ